MAAHTRPARDRRHPTRTGPVRLTFALRSSVKRMKAEADTCEEVLGLLPFGVVLTWPQLAAGGAGIALVAVGLIGAALLLPHIQWRQEPPAARAYVVLLTVGAIVGGFCWIVAAAERSRVWELAGAVVLVGATAGRWTIARWLRRSQSDNG